MSDRGTLFQITREPDGTETRREIGTVSRLDISTMLDAEQFSYAPIELVCRSSGEFPVEIDGDAL